MTARTIGRVLAVVGALTIGACGNDDTGGGAGRSTSAAAEETTPRGNEDATSASLDGTRDALGVGTLALDAVDEGGSHPTLSWQAVDGADTYWLVVHDAGRPFWAWTGSATSVRLGGGDRPETNQTAARTGTMTWSVLALDADGSPIALSEDASLEP